MANFENSFNNSLKFLTGYSIDNRDASEILFNIDRKTNHDLKIWSILDSILEKFKPLSKAKFSKIMEECLKNEELMNNIKEYFRENYWNKIHGDEIYSQFIADNLYDCSINRTPKEAIILIQKCLKRIIQDGIMDKKTLQLINSVNQTQLNNAIVERRLDYIRRYTESIVVRQVMENRVRSFYK